MRIGAAIGLSFAASALLSGCVAALLPLAAAGALGKGEIDRAAAKRAMVAVGAVDLQESENSGAGEPGSAAEFTGQGGANAYSEFAQGDNGAAILAFLDMTDGVRSPYRSFAAHAREQSVRLDAGEGIQSVVLVPRVDIFAPETMSCEGKPLAVVIDLDHQAGLDWTSAEAVYRQTGLIEALQVLRMSEISVIWLSDQPVAAAEKISAILADGGLADEEADDFLFLDRGGEDRKQVRRWDAARHYCIVAIAGDERADFDELYDYLRNPDSAIHLESMFDSGWFLTPPPLVEAADVEALDYAEGDGQNALDP